MGGGSPFAVPPTVATFVVVETQELVCRGEGLEAAVVVFNVFQPLFLAVVAVVNGIADGD